MSSSDAALVVDTLTHHFSAMHGTSSKKDLLQILSAVIDATSSPSSPPSKQAAMEKLCFEEICQRLAIDRCIIQEIIKLLDTCCKKKFACCLPLL